MRILESSDTVGIHNSNRYNTYDFTASEIMSYVTSRGYNSFILDPYYSNGGYWVLMFNAVLDNGGLYLLDFNPNADTDRTGFYGSEGGYNRFVCASSSTSFEDVSLGITWTYESYTDGRFYFTKTEYLSDMHNLPFAFYTTLNYSKLYVNGEDVTPVSYQWSSVPAISGKNGILSLTTIKDEELGDGSPVSRAGREVLGSLSQSLNSIVSNMSKDQTVDLAYSGDTYKVTITMLDRTVLSVRLDFYTMPTTPGGVPPIIYSYSTYLNEIVDPGEKYLGFIIDRENEVAALNMIKLFNINVNRYVDYNVPGATMSAEDMHNLFIWLMGSSLPENWDDTDGLIDDEGDGGGDENPDIYNPIPEPGLSQKSA